MYIVHTHLKCNLFNFVIPNGFLYSTMEMILGSQHWQEYISNGCVQVHPLFKWYLCIDGVNTKCPLSKPSIALQHPQIALFLKILVRCVLVFYFSLFSKLVLYVYVSIISLPSTLIVMSLLFPEEPMPFFAWHK